MQLTEILNKAERETSRTELTKLAEMFSTSPTSCTLSDERYQSELSQKNLTQQIDAHLHRGFDPKDSTIVIPVLEALKKFDQRAYQNPVDELLDGLRICAQLADAVIYLDKVKSRLPDFVKEHPSRYSIGGALKDIVDRTPKVIGELNAERYRIVNYLISKVIPKIGIVKKLGEF